MNSLSSTISRFAGILILVLIGANPVFGQSANAPVDVIHVFTVGVIIFFILVLLSSI